MPAGSTPSAGQSALEPVQVSVASHVSADARQTVPDDLNVSGGQFGPVPSHNSLTSQSPATGRQMKAPPLLPWNTSGGQSTLVPSQFSAMSHGPAAARHWVRLDMTPSGGQLLLVPSQFSGASQTPAAARQTAVLFASLGQVLLVPVQLSATSQTPPAARQTAPELPGGC